MLSNCGHDENGRYKGGKAGDQTGNEYALIKWYNRPWKCVLRFPDKKVAAKIAQIARAAAENDCIGYDQGERTTYYQALKLTGWDPAKIRVDCECDCSSSTAANIIAAGHLCGVERLTKINPNMTTYNMRSALVAVGFECLTDYKHLIVSKYLKDGDILLNDSCHVAVWCADDDTEEEYDMPMIKQGSKGKAVKIWQVIVGVTADGEYGPQTLAATKVFQGKYGLEVDGIVGPKSWKAGLNSV